MDHYEQLVESRRNGEPLPVDTAIHLAEDGFPVAELEETNKMIEEIE